MKTVMELLGSGYSGAIFKPYYLELLELVAQRAREEMRNECARVVGEQCRIYDEGSDSCPELLEDVMDEAIRTLPTKGTP